MEANAQTATDQWSVIDSIVAAILQLGDEEIKQIIDALEAKLGAKEEKTETPAVQKMEGEAGLPPDMAQKAMQRVAY